MPNHFEFDRILIGGKAVTGNGSPLDVENPSTEEIFTSVPTVGASQVETAIAAARSSFDAGTWSNLPVARRLETLGRMAGWLEERRDTLTATAVTEVGAPLAIAGFAQVGMALDQARQLPTLFATLPEWEHNEMPLTEMVTPRDVLLSIRRYEAVGVVTAITPYNFPLQTNVWKVFSALAAGCSVILRPSPFTPLTAIALGEAALAADLPPGVLSVVVEDGTDGAIQLTSDPRIDCVSFTGSTTVGRQIAAQAAPTVKRMILELGGKSVQMYLPDGIDRLSSGVGTFLFSHSGQACTAQTRILVPHADMESSLETITSMLPGFKVGNPNDPDTVLGPVISAAQRDRIEALVAAGIDAGAELVAGGSRPAHLDKGYFVEPTLLRIKDNSNPVAQQEAFGPVLTIQGYSDIDEAVVIANDSEYGLGGGIYTADLPAGVALANRIRSGTVQVNRSAPNAYTSTGGYKQSGVGRERGVVGLREYQEVKHVVVGS